MVPGSSPGGPTNIQSVYSGLYPLNGDSQYSLNPVNDEEPRAAIALKTPYDDGTTHVVLSPMEFMGRLAALVPRPRVNLTRFHGVFSPNSKLRKDLVPQKPVEEQENQKPKSYSMTWAKRLKRVFAIEIVKCEKCGGSVRIIASIEDPEIIQKILKHHRRILF